MVAETMIRKPGPTPNGGAYSEARFLDAQGNPVSKDKATRVEITEYTRTGKRVATTYGECVHSQAD